MCIRIAGDAEPFLNVVRALPFVHAADADGDVLHVSPDNPDEHNPLLVRALIDAGAAIRYVEPRKPALEESTCNWCVKESRRSGHMRKALIILHKEWLELRSERTLWMTILIPPLLLTILPIVSVYLIGMTPDEDAAQLGAVIADPSLAGLSEMELGQAVMGKQFGLMFLLMPLIIPSAIASYSIIGEKTRRTLEPLLAAPIQTWELLLGKCLASLVPAIVISWGAALTFVLALRRVVLSDQVYRVILSGGWWVLLLLGSPSLALLMVSATVAISGRVNDPRTAQQVAAVVVAPLLALFVAQLLGVVVLTPLLASIASAALAFLAALAFAGAIALFDRENILTRWTS